MGSYKVRFAPTDLMPNGEAWAICRKNGMTVLYLNRDVAQAATWEEKEAHLESAWEGFRALVEQGEADIDIDIAPPARVPLQWVARRFARA